MTTALWISNVEVTDPDTYAKYVPIAGEAIAAHGGVFLCKGGPHHQLEGRDRARNVVIRFPSMEAARACYASPRYQEAMAFARVASTRDVVIVEEVED